MERYAQKKASKKATMLGRSQVRTSNFSHSGAPNSALLSSMNLDNAPNPESDIKSAILSRFSFSSETTADEMPASTAARPIRIPSSIQEKAEQIYQAPLDGVKAFEDEGLQESGFSGYAHGPEIHIDRNLEPQKRESVILHEVGHVIQRGSGMANGSGYLDSPKLEGLADSGFIAPQSFTMPSAVSGPVMGCPDPPTVRDEIKSVFDQMPTFLSTSGGNVGSIYFGSDVSDGPPPDRESLEDATPGGRIRLLHAHGPEIVQYPHVRRYNQDPEGRARVYERMTDSLGHGIIHTSRGSKGHLPPGLEEKDYKDLAQLVAKAQLICADEIAVYRRARDRRAEADLAEAKTALRPKVLEANKYLYQEMKKHSKLREIKLDVDSAGGIDVLEEDLSD